MKGLTKRGAEEGAYPAEEMARSGGELALMWLLQSAYDTSVQLSSDVLTSVSEAAGYGGSTVEGLHRVAPQVFVSVAPALDASQLPEDVRGAQQPMVWNLGERLPAAELERLEGRVLDAGRFFRAAGGQPLLQLLEACACVDDWVLDAAHVAIVHSDAASGESALLFSACLLLWTGRCDSAQRAAQIMCEKLCLDDAMASLLPSQLRSLMYVEDVCRLGLPPETCAPLVLQRIIAEEFPAIGEGSDLLVEVIRAKQPIFVNAAQMDTHGGLARIDPNVCLEGDITLRFSCVSRMGGGVSELFTYSCHCAWMPHGLMRVHLADMDVAAQNESVAFAPDFFFDVVATRPERAELGDRTDLLALADAATERFKAFGREPSAVGVEPGGSEHHWWRREDWLCFCADIEGSAPGAGAVQLLESIDSQRDSMLRSVRSSVTLSSDDSGGSGVKIARGLIGRVVDRVRQWQEPQLAPTADVAAERRNDSTSLRVVEPRIVWAQVQPHPAPRVSEQVVASREHHESDDEIDVFLATLEDATSDAPRSVAHAVSTAAVGTGETGFADALQNQVALAREAKQRRSSFLDIAKEDVAQNDVLDDDDDLGWDDDAWEDEAALAEEAKLASERAVRRRSLFLEAASREPPVFTSEQ